MGTRWDAQDADSVGVGGEDLTGDILGDIGVSTELGLASNFSLL